MDRIHQNCAVNFKIVAELVRRPDALKNGENPELSLSKTKPLQDVSSERNKRKYGKRVASAFPIEIQNALTAK